uniref:Reverse transcriptase domain-containing protein n=1 Tax=Fagus sylvatica TaxID=28930 RepID=A0A2N9GNM8_FAGSY
MNEEDLSARLPEGRFLTQKPINFRATRSTLRLAWRMGDDVRIVEVGNGLLQFRFAHAFQMKWVLEHGPWNFDNHLLVLRPWKRGLTTATTTFTHALFWVQIWGLPFDLMDPGVGETIGHNLGNFVLVDKRSEFMDSASFLQIRVEIPIAKPLRRGGYILSPEGEQVWVQYKYERLPLFCHSCGRLGHSVQACTHTTPPTSDAAAPVLPYGEWLRASPNSRPIFQCSPREGVSQNSLHPTTNPVQDDDMQQNTASHGGCSKSGKSRLRDSKSRQIWDRVPINEPSLETFEESTSPLPAQSDQSVHNTRTPLTSVTDSILNIPVLHNHYHNQFAEIQERTKTYGTWKRAIKMEGDMPPSIHADHPLVGSKRGRKEEVGRRHWVRKITQEGPWNCRGLGNPKAIRALHEMVQSKVPSILFLIETKMDNSEMTVVRSRLGFHNALIVPSMGRSGGLAMLWKDDVELAIQSYSHHHIDSLIKSTDSFHWSLPWLCVGDFNEILEQSEKRGLLDRSLQKMLEFRSALNSCQLIDIGYHGPIFTWDNGRHGAANVQERLDRATATLNWLDKFHGTIVHNVLWSSSDHLPLLIECGSTPSPVQTGKRPHRFEEKWATNRECEEIIRENELNLRTKTKALEGLRLDNQDGKNNELIHDLNSEINAHLHKAEIHWRQRSRAVWLQAGDKNTKYFHFRASQRQRKNRIQGLFDSNNIWQEEASSVAHTTEQYFKDIFSTSHPPQIDYTINSMEAVVTQEHNSTLLLNFEAEEVRKAVFQMPPSKSPGPDDNVAVAYELMHTMRSKRKGKIGYMAMKLDMSKAYDRVEWAFLKAAMLKMGFAQRWVDLVMECVSTPTYSVLINGVPQGYIHPSRGVRQGDPLSPYIFLICAEGLSSLIRKAELAGLIHGISASRYGPKISHLFFADDSLLLSRASVAEVQHISSILEAYEQASGQKINKTKTSLYFSPNTPATTRTEICSILGVSAHAPNEKYLGLPVMIGKSKTRTFNELKERVTKKLVGWKEKTLSSAGREILIKAVVQAIPSYTMSCFKLPRLWCTDIKAPYWKIFGGGSKGQSEKFIGLTGPLCVNRRRKEPIFGSTPRHESSQYVRPTTCSHKGQTNQIRLKDQMLRTCEDFGSIYGVFVIPPKSKHFLWRACLNVLPTRANLTRRGLTIAESCAMCPYQSETVTHILWACPLARNVWSLLPGKVQKLANTEDKDFFDISSLVASILTRSEFEQWTMTCWAIWNARNRYVFEGVQEHPSKILESASKLLNDYREACTTAAARSS